VAQGPPAFAIALADVAGRRAAVYRALAIAFYPPDRDFVEAILDGSWVRTVGEAIAWLGPDAARFGPALQAVEASATALRPATPEAALRTLRVGYARLFEGPGKALAVPYEAWYVDRLTGGEGRLNGPSTARVALAYRARGLERALDHHDFPDHVATELEFCHALASLEAAAWRAGDLDGAGALRAETDSFLRAHPARWWPAFAGEVRGGPDVALYGALADLLKVQLSIEIAEGLTPDDLPWGGG
jgi:TorA maturation chaperone TorD